MGCPSLGEHTKLEVVIEESYEFKVTSSIYFKATHRNLLYCYSLSSCPAVVILFLTVTANSYIDFFMTSHPDFKKEFRQRFESFELI